YRQLCHDFLHSRVVPIDFFLFLRFLLWPPPTSTLFPYTTLFRSTGCFTDPTNRYRGVESSGVGQYDAVFTHASCSFFDGCPSSSTPCARSRNRAARCSPPVGSFVITRTVSSPAIVPRTSVSTDVSIADARNCAAPGGVRKTTRFAEASAETSSSVRSRPSRAACSSASPAPSLGWPSSGTA